MKRGGWPDSGGHDKVPFTYTTWDCLFTSLRNKQNKHQNAEGKGNKSVGNEAQN